MAHKGFTLLELLIALAISTILVAVAWPSYRSFVIKSRRSDAIIALNRLQLAQEKHRANYATYGTLTELGGSATSPSGHYGIAVADNTATGYMLTATALPGSTQASDSGCITITLTQSGATTTQGPKSLCWNQ